MGLPGTAERQITECAIFDGMNDAGGVKLRFLNIFEAFDEASLLVFALGEASLTVLKC